MSLSLLGPCAMDFRHPATGRKERLLVPPRSLVVMSDGARSDREHATAPRKRDPWHGRTLERRRQVSVTFRFLAGGGGT